MIFGFVCVTSFPLANYERKSKLKNLVITKEHNLRKEAERAVPDVFLTVRISDVTEPAVNLFDIRKKLWT